MANTEILNYLVEGKRRGFEISFLKKKLLDNGFDKTKVDQAEKEMENIPVSEVKGEEKNRVIVKSGKENGGIKVDKPSGLGIFSKMKKSLTHPTELFTITKMENMSSPLKYYLVLSILPFLIASVLIWFLFDILIGVYLIDIVDLLGLGSVLDALSWIYIVTLFVGIFIALPLLSFIAFGVVHAVSKVFKGTGKYGDSYRAMMYASTPQILFWWIPVINIVAMIWSIVLQIIGLSVNHNIGKGRAFLIWFVSVIVIPVSILFGLGLIIILAFGY